MTLTLDLWLWPWPLTFELDLHSTLNVKFWRIFCDVISLLARVFIVSFDRAYKEVSTKKYWKFSVAQFLWYDCTLQKPMYRPCDLDLWPMKVNYFLWIDYQPISVLYKFEIDSSTNSREIKYLNIEMMGMGILHVKRNTRQIWRYITPDRHQIWHTDAEYE